jgi:glycosyltransferase involved in cell wall biosynthesis
MRIAQIAPLYESVPPALYGGTERVVSYLTEELVRQGHEVTLFASGDSKTRARLVACAPRSLRLDPRCFDSLAFHVLQLEKVYRRAEDFDVLHFHTDYLHFPTSLRRGVPHVTTLHGRLNIRELKPLYRTFRRVPVVSISNAQRRPLPHAHWVGTVLHGLPLDAYTPARRGGDYLAFVGRCSPEKGLVRAIEIARRAGRRLVIAAKVDRVDVEYFESVVKPRLADPHVDFIGEVDERGKQKLLGGARALLFPIDWPEPFGLVMIEAMACGTPVIATPRGSVPEVIAPGVSGAIVRTMSEAVRAVQSIDDFDRAAVRAEFERRFSSERMAQDYTAVYRRVIARRAGSVPSAATATA